MTIRFEKRIILYSLLMLVIAYVSCSKENNNDLFLAEYMSPSEFEAAAKDPSIAYIPIGVIEWHNEHLPLGYDTIKAFELCKRIREKTGGVIFPPLYFGTEAIGTVGSINLSPELVEDLFRSVIDNLISEGFRVIVTLTGHTPAIQINILKNLAKEAEAKNKYIRVIALTEGTFVHDEEIELFGHYQDHAAAGETSILLYTRPELVHLDRLKYPIQPKREGILWDPRYGSKENGDKIVKLIAKRSADFIRKEREKLFSAYPDAPQSREKAQQGASILDDMQPNSYE